MRTWRGAPAAGPSGVCAAGLRRFFTAGVTASAPLLVLLLLAWMAVLGHRGVDACNVYDNGKIIHFTNNEPGSFFGYTVLQHRNGYGTWILVGAPRGQSASQSSIERPGALYRCQSVLPNNCYEVTLDTFNGNQDLPDENLVEVRDNQWLGVSLTRQNKDRDADVTVCGHLSKNDYFVRTDPDNEYSDRYVNGVCYTIDSLFLESSSVKMRPCKDELQVNGSYAYHAHCEAGISATYNEDGTRLVMGAVGSYEWNGTTIDAQKDRSNYRYRIANLTDWGSGQKDENEYIGYSVSTGHFLSSTTEQGVTGAPRSKQVGKVFVYDLDTFQVYQELQGDMSFSYYGASVLGVDLNSDGLSDLLVGAPLYSDKLDEGRVYVYINQGEGRLVASDFKLEGSNAAGGRFGTTMAFIGDVNRDGFNDVAIGAPYEDESTGAVYIYRGQATGIRRTYTQRLAARELLPGILSFGSSIAGGMDVDYNYYPDLVVGSYANDSAYMFKTLPVVKLEVWIEVSPETLDPEFNNCELAGRPITCLTVSACFLYTDNFGLPDEILFDYNLEADVLKTEMAATPRLFFQSDGGDQPTSVAGTVELTKNKQACFPRFVYLKPEARDFLTQLKFVINYNIFGYPDEPPPRGDSVESPFAGGLAPVLDNALCSNGTAEKTVLFIRECGSDSICQTDLRVSAGLTLTSGNDYITLGGESVVYLMATVENQGEEAHQAELLISHPREVVFESLESSAVDCVMDASGSPARCVPDNLITCSPREALNVTAEVLCSLGNPMRSRTANTLRLRFDVGGLSVGRRLVDFKLKASTLSLEEASLKGDNEATPSMPVRIVADLAVRGVVQPEQLFYFPDNETIDGEAPDEGALLRDALVAAGLLQPGDGSTPETNLAAIGQNFTHVYEVGNQGPGRLPYDLVFTAQLPWATEDGDWLIFLRNIELQGEGSCDSQRVMDLQRALMREHYLDKAGALAYTQPGEIVEAFRSDHGIDCLSAKCVTLTCHIRGPLQAGKGAVVSVDAVLWQRTLIDNDIGSVDLVSTLSVALRDTSQSHMQPEDDAPDTILLKTMVFTDTEPERPVEPWIIAVSTIGGVIGLIILIAVLWKLGFFKRKEKDKLAQALDGGM